MRFVVVRPATSERVTMYVGTVQTYICAMHTCAGIAFDVRALAYVNKLGVFGGPSPWTCPFAVGLTVN